MNEWENLFNDLKKTGMGWMLLSLGGIPFSLRSSCSSIYDFGLTCEICMKSEQQHQQATCGGCCWLEKLAPTFFHLIHIVDHSTNTTENFYKKRQTPIYIVIVIIINLHERVEHKNGLCT